MASLGKSGRAAGTYILLAGLQRGVSLLILPFITHVMSPVEYGAASMLSAAALFLTTLIAAPLIPLIVRAAARGDEDGPALLRATGTYCYFVVPVAVALIALAVTLFVPEALGVAGFIWGVELLAIALQPAASTFAMWVAQARADIRTFVWLSSTSVAVTAVTKLVLVVILQMGVLGWVVSDLISAFVSAILAISVVRLPRARVHRSHIRQILKFTLPLIPHSAALWALTSLSRPAMAAVSSLDQVGLLSFGLNLASLAILVLTEANRAALGHYSRETFPAPTAETLATVRWQLVGAFAIPAIVGCGVAVAGQWIFAEAYWPAFSIAGILLVGQAAYGLYLIPMNYLTQTAGLTKYSALASGAGALLILVWIILTGEKYGAIGVAYGTAAGYAAMAIVAMVIVVMHRLDIAWMSWLAEWPIAIGGVTALGFSITALAAPVGSNAVWIFSAAAALLLLGMLFWTARRARPI